MKESDIRKGMVRKLEAKGTDTPYFLALVDDYIFLHNRVQKMKASIRKEGAEYEATSAAGKKYMKENPAAKNIILYNRQMLAILKELSLDTENAGGLEDDEL